MSDELQGRGPADWSYTVRITGEGRFQDTVRALAAKTAESTGCPPERASGFGRAVDDVVGALVGASDDDRATIGLQFDWRAGRLSVAIAGSSPTSRPGALAGEVGDLPPGVHREHVPVPDGSGYYRLTCRPDA